MNNENTKTAIVTFGKFQVTHIGHQKVFESMMNIHKQTPDSTIIIQPSSSYNKKHPIPFFTKIQLLKDLHPLYAQYISEKKISNIINFLIELNQTYNKIILVCGSDRQQDFVQLINQYNNKLYNFSCIEIRNAGFRDRTNKRFNASSTLMKSIIKSNNFNSFVRLSPNTEPFNLILAYNIYRLFLKES